MMKVLIIEDEVLAAEKIERYLKKYDPSIEICQKTQSIEESLAWLKGHGDQLDLIFSDIQLPDGLSFEIFQQWTKPIPVIFTTAYDEYALDAFKVNGIDYLLKPVTFLDLSTAMKKLNNLERKDKESPGLGKVADEIETQSYKKRFLVKLGEHIHSIKVDDIFLFYAEGRTVYLINRENRKFVVDFKMEELENLLQPDLFFRVNRSFLININAIQDVVMYSNSRLKVKTAADIDKEIVVSRERVQLFKNWLEGK